MPQPSPDLSQTFALLEKLQAAIRQDDRAQLVDLIKQLIATRADLRGQWVGVLQIAAANGELRLADEAMELFVESIADDPLAPYRKVALLVSIGAWQEAYALLSTLDEGLPDPGAYAHSRGTAALYAGKSDEARTYLEKATRLLPEAGSPWMSISVLVDFAREPELAERIIAAESAIARAARSEQAAYYYALGKAHADRGEHRLAFAAIEKGAGLNDHRPYSRERDRFTATDAVSGYDAARIEALAAQQSEPTGRAIFVTGLPRSGTSLVEQILTSHSEVSDGGEIYRLSLLIKEVGGLSYPALKSYVDERHAPDAARLWRHWLDERFPAPGRVVDKTLNASRLLGLAAGLLPEAPLIWMVRDPLDCAWSCYRTRFAGEANWSFDLEDMAYHFRLEDELRARWQEILGSRLLVVPYEDLVTEPEPWIRRIMSHCGLAEENQVFAPHENARAMPTASVMQVRQPINRGAIGSAEPYREFLQPFIEAYYR